MTPLTLNASGNQDKDYRAIIESAGNTYLLVITPIVRMGCHSLNDASGAVTIEIFKKNAQYPKGFEFGDNICTHAAGGKNLAEEMIKFLNRSFQESKVLSEHEYLNSITVLEDNQEYIVSDSGHSY